MRLLTKTTLYFLLAMVPMLAAGGFYLYFQFSKELNNEMDDELVNDELQWVRYLENETENNGPFVLKTPELTIFPVNAPLTTYAEIKDTYVFQEISNVKVPYRQLSQVVPVNGIPYQIIIRKSQLEKSVLFTNVTRIMLFVFIGLFAATLLFNWFISTRLWMPFQHSLQKIRQAELTQMETMHFEDTSIKEFNELNSSLNAMANKIHMDYVNMKEFTEDAAHEMQTPLAVAQSRLELLLQDNNLTDEQVDSILQASTAIKRLGKLNQSLLLLAKIENNQYDTNETISLVSITNNYLQLFEEIIKDKHIVIEKNVTGDCIVKMHPLLAESLISNLIGNAVKYNYPGGLIIISVTDSTYSISNTSNLSAIEPKQLFKRFKKFKEQADNSNGLGLAIVKKIIDTHNLTIRYNYENGKHEFSIKK
ncbi:MAG: HAMP domain-containing sensor histidine kinase, partial [Chitinophagaceae bacterium]